MQYQAAVKAYKKAAESSAKYIPEHPIAANMKDVLSSATRKIAENLEKTALRKLRKGEKLKSAEEIEQLLLDGTHEDDMYGMSLISKRCLLAWKML